MSIPTDWKLKTAAENVLYVVERSEKVGIGLSSLSELIDSHTAHGGEFDATQLRGLSVLIDSLHEQLTHCPNEHLESINMVREYSQS